MGYYFLIDRLGETFFWTLRDEYDIDIAQSANDFRSIEDARADCERLIAIVAAKIVVNTAV